MPLVNSNASIKDYDSKNMSPLERKVVTLTPRKKSMPPAAERKQPDPTPDDADNAETENGGIYSANYAAEELKRFDQQHDGNSSSD